MPKVTFITPEDERIVVDTMDDNVMEAAVNEDLEGIEGDCGGVCSCCTCHVHVEPEWMERVGKPGEQEADMLEQAENRNERSRLSCQIELTDELDGLVVRIVPEEHSPGL